MSIKSFTLETVDDVKAWFRYLVKDLRLHLHPDDPFADYRDPGTGGKPSFTPEEAIELDQTMAKAHEICDDQIYAIAIEVMEGLALQNETIEALEAALAYFKNGAEWVDHEMGLERIDAFTKVEEAIAKLKGHVCGECGRPLTTPNAIEFGLCFGCSGAPTNAEEDAAVSGGIE